MRRNPECCPGVGGCMTSRGRSLTRFTWNRLRSGNVRGCSCKCVAAGIPRDGRLAICHFRPLSHLSEPSYQSLRC